MQDALPQFLIMQKWYFSEVESEAQKNSVFVSVSYPYIPGNDEDDR